MERAQNYGITVLHPKENSADTAIDESDIVFDLVAIHGLAGDPFTTWTHVKGQPMWLRDLLPLAMPNVRVMTYGYNASFLNYTAKQDVRSIAAKLLTELADLRLREMESRRPIVFVCHSLGGIIAKKALLLETSNEHARVQESVYGIIFLATPHSGSSLATYGSALATITKYCSPLNPPQALLETLRKDSHILLELTADFIAKATQLQIASFYEMKMTRVGLMKKMIVKETSAVLMLPNEVRIGQNSDHREIARFLSLQDRNFRPLLKRLEIFKDGIAKKLKSLSCTSPPREKASLTPAQTYECPSLPCDTFQGRETVLQSMDHYFDYNSAQDLGQLRFALCGFGGVGKTQVALKYADNFRRRYPGGVFFISARSESTITADLSRICETLQLSDGTSLPSRFNRWLSSRENINYLLIFDNADDLESVPMPNYVPKTSWGHVIFTSRDQGIIGTLAKTGALLDQLALDEAILVLLQKANVLSPSPEEFGHAQDIVQQFACLPLAIDQAGAYIKARQKSLSAFKKLCSQRQSDILKYKPRLAGYDQTVFTTWEINFEQVESNSVDARNLILLFCYLDAAKIPEAMLDRACSRQKRWSHGAEVTEEAPSASGVDKDLIQTVKDELRFDDAIEMLKSFSLIYVNEDEHTGLRNFSIHPLVQFCASQRVPVDVQNYWRKQAIALICHAFPRDEFLEPFYFSAGIAQMPHARRIFNESRLLLETIPESPNRQSDMVGLYISTSRFGTTTWKMEATRQAKKLLQGLSDPYLCMLVASRESSILRMKGENAESEEVLEESMRRYMRLDQSQDFLSKNPRYNAQAGKLLQSRAENLIAVDNLEQAQRELLKWSPVNDASSSSMEKTVQVSIKLTLGRLSKIQGHFKEALAQFNPTFDWIVAEDIDAGGWRRVLLANIGEAYCELGQPADAQSLLTAELDCMKLTRCQNTSSGLRLQLVLAESYLGDGSHDRSKEVAHTVRSVLEGSKEHNSITRRFYLRTWMILARIAHAREHWEEALGSWRKGLEILNSMRDSSGPNTAIVEFGIAYALLKRGLVHESADMEALARAHLKAEKVRRYHLTGFDSYWRDAIVAKFASKTETAADPSREPPPVPDLLALKI